MTARLESLPAERTDVLLVGYEDRDNLGIRYLLSSLRRAGHSGDIVRYRSDPRDLIDRVRSDCPIVIGFSLIFQYMAPDFEGVIRALRAAGIKTHITMGGHYPSFDPEEILRRIDGLDTVVRYEGEETLTELVERLKTGRPWQDILSIAYRNGDGVVTNALRPPVSDLDTLPRPERASFNYEAEPLPTAAILGSRGCPWVCTFCSIRPFYEAQGGALRRFRKPAEVVAEMLDLYNQRGIYLYLFQDDDFLAGGRHARQWACEIADQIIDVNLAGKIAFKISCRSDEIDRDCLKHLQRGGLTHVYMGVEAGDESDLLEMNKRLKPVTHLEAGKVLRSLDMSFDFGFMMLQPYSTFQTIRNNIQFLEEFVGDGYAVASFCRMLPYAGTPIKTRLEKEGRLLGTPFEPDYKFLDPKIDLFYDWILTTFHERNFTSGGLCHILRAMLFEAYANLEEKTVTPEQRDYLHYLASVCNRTALYTLRSAVDHIEQTDLIELEKDPFYLRSLTAHEHREEAELTREVTQLYASFGSRKPLADRIQELPGGFDKTWTIADSLSGDKSKFDGLR
jgi:radical SAM superfamily enzyme YgiQ (UPF0313 family)